MYNADFAYLDRLLAIEKHLYEETKYSNLCEPPLNDVIGQELQKVNTIRSYLEDLDLFRIQDVDKAVIRDQDLNYIPAILFEEDLAVNLYRDKQRYFANNLHLYQNLDQFQNIPLELRNESREFKKFENFTI
jgi:hypothetical protein